MFKKIIFLFIVFISLSGCSPSQENYLEVNNKKINIIDIADDGSSSYLGLSFRESLCANCGMLFYFKEKPETTFVMRNMLFPLDIIWIDNDEIVKIDKNLPPEGETPKNFYQSGRPVNFVLEVNGGFTEANNIKVGDKINFNLDYEFNK